MTEKSRSVERTPLVSVIIPNYNHADFLGVALQSVLAQSYVEWEAIVVDNHSQDSSDQVVTSMQDRRVRLLKIHNQGVIAASRNMGIANANGKWIAFLDSDDWWAPSKLEECMEDVEDSVDIIYHPLAIVREQSVFFRRMRTKCRQLEKPVLSDLLLNGNIISNSSVVVRKSILNDIGGLDEDPEMVASEDYNTWLKIAQISDGFLYKSKVLGSYRIHDGSISQLKDMSIPYQKALTGLRNSLQESQRKAYDGFFAYECAKHHYGYGDYDRAIEKLRLSISMAYLYVRFRAFLMLLRIYFLRLF